MASFNRVILIGNLTRDPEMRTTPSGDKVVEMRMAMNETYRSRQTNEVKEIPCYVNVIVWGNQADPCQQYLKKGSPVFVEGRLQYDEWKNDKGETRSRLQVRADRVQFLNPSPRKTGDAGEWVPTQVTPVAPTGFSPQGGVGSMPAEPPTGVEDLPF